MKKLNQIQNKRDYIEIELLKLYAELSILENHPALHFITKDTELSILENHPALYFIAKNTVVRFQVVENQINSLENALEKINNDISYSSRH